MPDTKSRPLAERAFNTIANLMDTIESGELKFHFQIGDPAGQVKRIRLASNMLREAEETRRDLEALMQTMDIEAEGIENTQQDEARRHEYGLRGTWG